jgi:hypothetical protein
MAKLSRSVRLPLRLGGEIVASVGFLVVAPFYVAFSVIIAVIEWLGAEWSLSQEARKAPPASLVISTPRRWTNPGSTRADSASGIPTAA